MPLPFITGSSFDRYNRGISTTGNGSLVQATVLIPLERTSVFSNTAEKEKFAVGLGVIPTAVYKACCQSAFSDKELILHEFGNPRSSSHTIHWRIHGWIISDTNGTPLMAFRGGLIVNDKIIHNILRYVFCYILNITKVHITNKMSIERNWRKQLYANSKNVSDKSEKAARMAQERLKAISLMFIPNLYDPELEDEIEAIIANADKHTMNFDLP